MNATTEVAPKEIEARLQFASSELLEWYFCEGKTSFAHSVTGPMLHRAELYRHGSYPCYKCEDSPGINPETGDWCKRCNGTGFHSFELYGNQDQITAWPTAETIEAKGYEPNHDVLQRYGKASRQLDAVRTKLGELGVRALESFHGDEGARWGRTKHGRLFAVYPHTKAGRRMLARAVSKNDPVELSACEKLGVQAELQAAQPKLWRRDLMDQAAVQAEKLYLDALAVFCAFDPKQTPKKSKPKHRRRGRRERELEAWNDGAPTARDAGFSYEELREAAGF